MLSKLPKALTIKDKILRDLFEIEMDFIAGKLGFSQSCKILKEKQIISTLKYIDAITSMPDAVDKNYVIAVLVLLWEHCDHKLFELRPAILKFLARIGYTSSAIAFDDEYDSARGSFSFINSIIDQISTTVSQTAFEYNLGGIKYVLTEFQKNVIDGIELNRHIGVSAPTSAGKTFAIILKTFELFIEKNYELIYIVPTLSLQNQIIENYTQLARDHSYSQYTISSVYQPRNNDMPGIYVLTQEKAITALSYTTSFNHPLVLIIDEIQNIEHVSNEDQNRSRVLLDMINEFRHMKAVEKVIISGPRIENIGTLGTDLLGYDTLECATSVSPVLNITYTISCTEREYFFKLYTPLFKKPLIKKLADPSAICNYGKVLYNDEYMDYLYRFVNKIGKGQQNIIFAPTSKTARAIALSFANKEKVTTRNELLYELSDYYNETVHQCYSLSNTILKGVAYHHGKVPTHVRRTLEKAISDKLILNVVCTTTLMQGVNLPAQNVILRNPNLFIKKTKNTSKLSDYEIANLRGRAGRLMKDLIGRTYILDEGQFEEDEEIKLFDEVTKQLSPSHHSRFEEYKDDIEEVILSADAVSEEMDAFGYLAIYIRQSLLRYGTHAKSRLEELGISLPTEIIKAGLNSMQNLTIPIEACLKNRYWDPFILEEIYQSYTGIIPRSPLDKDSKNSLISILEFFKKCPQTQTIFKESIPDGYYDDVKFNILCEYCIKWARGVKLRDILNNKYCNSEDSQEKIDEVINVIQSFVSYKIPLMIKPIFDMFEDDGVFVKSLQNGACEPVVVKLIEMGIPRETALQLHEDYFKDEFSYEGLSDDLESVLRKNIRDIKQQLPYWVKVQVDFI